MALYHLTSASSVERILLEGLRPLIGPRSKLCGETDPAIYLFKDIDAAETAMQNWFGETADEGDTIALIEVDDTGLELHDGAGYELIARVAIDPGRLHIKIADVDDPNAWVKLRQQAPRQ